MDAMVIGLSGEGCFGNMLWLPSDLDNQVSSEETKALRDSLLSFHCGPDVSRYMPRLRSLDGHAFRSTSDATQ